MVYGSLQRANKYADEESTLIGVCCSVIFALCIGFRLMHSSVWMLGRRIDRIELERTFADVDDVVPRAGRNDNGGVGGHTTLITKRVAAITNINLGISAFNAYELINIRVHLNTDVVADRNTHKCELHMASGPESSAKIAVHVSRVIDIKYKRFGTVVANFGVFAAVMFLHDDTSLSGAVSVYARFTRFDKA